MDEAQEWEEDRPLHQAEIEEDDQRMIERQRNFRLAAEHVAAAFAGTPGVERVVLFGSVALPLHKEVPRFREYRRAGVAIWHECKDVDLAVWLRDLTHLKKLRRIKAHAASDYSRDSRIGVSSHQVEVFIVEPGTDRYLGRLCEFATCPKGKEQCLVLNCGTPPFLQQHFEFEFKAESLAADKIVVLYEGWDPLCDPGGAALL